MSSSASERAENTRTRALALRRSDVPPTEAGGFSRPVPTVLGARPNRPGSLYARPPSGATVRGQAYHTTPAKTPGPGLPRCPWCRREVQKSRGYHGGLFCRKDCWEAAWMSALPPATFSPLARSLPAATRRCPRPGCGGPLAREGAFLHCWCGGRWPITGAPLSEALEYERRSGARTAGQ